MDKKTTRTCLKAFLVHGLLCREAMEEVWMHSSEDAAHRTAQLPLAGPRVSMGLRRAVTRTRAPAVEFRC